MRTYGDASWYRLSTEVLNLLTTVYGKEEIKFQTYEVRRMVDSVVTTDVPCPDSILGDVEVEGNRFRAAYMLEARKAGTGDTEIGRLRTDVQDKWDSLGSPEQLDRLNAAIENAHRFIARLYGLS